MCTVLSAVLNACASPYLRLYCTVNMHRQYTAIEVLQQILGESSNDKDTEDMDDGGGLEINKVIANPTDVDSDDNMKKNMLKPA